MDDKHSHLLAFALTVSWLLLIALPHSHSQPSPCAKQSYRCNISVSAIFDPPWEQIPASQCNGADTSSLLSCHVFYDNVPIESQNFTVKDINNTAHTMKVMLTPPVTDVCSPHFLNFDYQTFNNTLLQYNASVHKIIIFRNCPIIPKFPSKRKFTCGDVLYYFEEEEMLHRYPPLQNCTGRWEVPAATPLDGYDDSNDGAGVLEQALNDAFEVNYSIIPDGCCRESEGTCWRDGYYGEHVVSCNYYCPNQNCSPKGGNLNFSRKFITGNGNQKRRLIILGVTCSAIAAMLILISIFCVRYKSPTDGENNNKQYTRECSGYNFP